jgi:hypothetical protein
MIEASEVHDRRRASVLSALVSDHEGAQLRGGGFLHPGCHVAVDVEGDRDRRVSEAFLNDLRVNTRLQ